MPEDGWTIREQGILTVTIPPKTSDSPSPRSHQPSVLMQICTCLSVNGVCSIALMLCIKKACNKSFLLSVYIKLTCRSKANEIFLDAWEQNGLLLPTWLPAPGTGEACNTLHACPAWTLKTTACPDRGRTEENLTARAQGARDWNLCFPWPTCNLLRFYLY